MARPIIMTEKMKQTAQEDFAAMLNDMKMSDGKLSYNKSFKCKDSRAIVWITEMAYQKILTLITAFSDEVGWHGTVSRLGECEFIIEDIFVYPQEVTGSTVNTNQAEYSAWLYSLDEDIFSNIRMQGHSHVNMGTTPSGVDNNHRQQILDQLESDMFYIFMIWNKRLEIHTLIYDMVQNIMYENKDIDVQLMCSEDVETFLTDAREKVQKKLNHKKNENQSPKNQAAFDAELAAFGCCHYFEDDFYDPYDLGGSAWRL